MQTDLELEKGIEIKQSKKSNNLGAGSSNDKEAGMNAGRGGSSNLRVGKQRPASSEK